MKRDGHQNKRWVNESWNRIERRKDQQNLGRWSSTTDPLFLELPKSDMSVMTLPKVGMSHLMTRFNGILEHSLLLIDDHWKVEGHLGLQHDGDTNIFSLVNRVVRWWLFLIFLLVWRQQSIFVRFPHLTCTKRNSPHKIGVGTEWSMSNVAIKWSIYTL